MSKNLSLSALWEKRYRTKPPHSLPTTETLYLQLSHKSVRHYRTQPLPEGALEAVIAAASSAPTSSNLQTWSVVAVKDAQKKEKLAELCGGQNYVAQAPLFLAWIADLSRLERLAQREGKSCEALDYQEAFLMASIDTAIAAQNAALACESLGLGTVYIGGLRNHPEGVSALLSLPKRSIAVIGMCVGYATDDARGDIKPRLSQDVVLHHEHYCHQTEKEHIEAYDVRANSYEKGQGQSERLWSDVAIGRIAQARHLGGRHMMRQILEKLGFSLK